ncbi:hypothetical protein [Levilactobacillus suantsaii]|uniref:Uncharacterized protein n=1 Tax=Levilactobacillus suantsaii TaxID=2292255 RepID=A0A4Q0VKD5_9LACO|nr:hypothetical protein [Levilactobacillus suantsaii]RXI78719.1 hypothetical protein DXH47_05640 [Levilactobacillus suantsaii]
MSQTVGEILTTLRQWIYQDDLDTFRAELTLFDLPDWYYLNLEHSQAHRLKPETKRLLMGFYGLPASDFERLRTADDLSLAMEQVLTDSVLRHEAELRLAMIKWPDSAQVARRFHGHPDSTDPAAKYSYADLLRFLRTACLERSVVEMAQLLDLPPLIYWQKETGQSPFAPAQLDWLGAMLGTDDLKTYTHATDLATAVRNRNAGGFMTAPLI